MYKTRICIALLAAFCVTAFAPAPLPRSQRKSAPPEDSLAAIQGTWRFVSNLEAVGGGRFTPFASGTVTHLRIKDDKWIFLPDNYPGSTLYMTIDHTRKPAVLRFYNRNDPGKTKVYGGGMVRRKGTQFQVLYRWGDIIDLPADFDNVPIGYWLRTLERDNNVPQ